MAAPFRVYKLGKFWWLRKNYPPYTYDSFHSPGEAIDHAYKNWPWYL